MSNMTTKKQAFSDAEIEGMNTFLTMYSQRVYRCERFGRHSINVTSSDNWFTQPMLSYFAEIYKLRFVGIGIGSDKQLKAMFQRLEE